MALAGLRRSELLALLWQDVDFEHASIRVCEGFSERKTGKPKSRKSRTVPMVYTLAAALDELNGRGHNTARHNHVFISRFGTELDGSALRRRYIAARDAAGLRPLPFHSLRHTFASVASITQLQAWMDHADVKTTMRYLHHKSRADDAQLLATAFHPSQPPQ